jgi:putative DNA primase/helicase
MKDDTTFDVALAPKRNSKRWKAAEVTWGELREWVTDPAGVKESGNYLLGRLSGALRGRHTIVDRAVATLDADTPKAGFLDGVGMLLDCAALVHTTFNSAPDSPRYRLLIPLSRRVLPDEYEALVDFLMRRLGLEAFDPGSREPSRYMFKPATQHRDWYEWREIDGGALDVDAVLADWDGDLSSRPTPRSSRKRDPLDLPGVVGAFNRAYSIAEAITAYDLPYEPVGDRWHLVGARAEAGMGYIGEDELLVYSHHVSDPAYGQACSAFDLVRLHRFADADLDAEEDTPLNRLPSYQAMQDLATKDERVISQVVGVDFNDLDLDDSGMDGDTDDRWKAHLAITRDGKLRDTVDNWDLLVEHDPVLKALFVNGMTGNVETSVDYPWRPTRNGGAELSISDQVQLKLYLEREYRTKVLAATVNELVVSASGKRWKHPLREYLLGLRWDGVPRVEECLPGVRPTAFTRLVARKCLVAAVARVLEPGCKWDHTLVLYGDEGLGKTHWIERLSKGYMATLGRVGDKDTLLTMQRSWIMVADEGHSLRKGDADAMKEFLTRTEDVYRTPYDKGSRVQPRSSVIWSTTNDEVFLRKQEGNRRFLIVHCEDKVDFEEITDEYVDQLWAEAMHMLRAGELLFLDEEQSVLANQQRERFTEEDALAGRVQAHLDQPVPEGWATMTADARRTYTTGLADGMVAEGTGRIEQVCSAELYVDVLDGRWESARRRAEMLELGTVMKRMPGWSQVPGRVDVPHYGPQVVFRRDPDIDELL